MPPPFASIRGQIPRNLASWVRGQKSLHRIRHHGPPRCVGGRFTICWRKTHYQSGSVQSAYATQPWAGVLPGIQTRCWASPSPYTQLIAEPDDQLSRPPPTYLTPSCTDLLVRQFSRGDQSAIVLLVGYSSAALSAGGTSHWPGECRVLEWPR